MWQHHELLKVFTEDQSSEALGRFESKYKSVTHVTHSLLKMNVPF